MTLMQKLEKYSPDAGFAIVLLTADDMGTKKNEKRFS
jgi:predicted nucleotide-binding protein